MRLYKRIVLLCFESVSQKMLPFYNKNIPVETMPFLHTLLGSHPRLDKLCTAHSPTNHGMHALLSSRMAYDYDMRHGIGRIDSLASLLREAGYGTYFLTGVTRHYGDKELFCKSLLRYEHFFSEESVRALYDSPPSLQWGIADKVMFDLALRVLDAQRDAPVFLTLHTLNTHPTFFHSLEEDAFPEYIRKTSSKLLRALFESDRDIMGFFKGLGKLRLLDEDTLVIITSDHSPSAGPEYLEFFGADDYSPDLIPCLFVTGKGSASPFAGLNPNTVCSQLDFLPTIVDALGLRRPGHLMGRSLFCGQDNPVISQYSHDLRIKTRNADCFVNIAPGNDLGEAEFLRKWYNNNLLDPYTAKG
ncbi:hypothetical protein KL86DPRO_10933 [uncultured delta proteobacterium]|uniref:Sulfatase N-terminal domain-containing protein n=1 Tax=uncultured delta proteobacterium TaxID=34034 RepID=A0A212J8M5_9DELT|nr:hypothetical protein KL86DPRO_10933 [uncultured delta proteobacterium]